MIAQGFNSLISYPVLSVGRRPTQSGLPQSQDLV